MIYISLVIIALFCISRTMLAAPIGGICPNGDGPVIEVELCHQPNYQNCRTATRLQPGACYAIENVTVTPESWNGTQGLSSVHFEGGRVLGCFFFENDDCSGFPQLGVAKSLENFGVTGEEAPVFDDRTRMVQCFARC
ncbi:hypothetical protein EJ08DRAFT_478286 [Tothia fuscella]|uniref:Uncharacterized protein n=1 Tax=Tothia fuscella TaxID=1048955 RepID=A0A9P4NI03_9PEZI|nr:hypothetical protein EJ08DRAFT_478286 [Tothia fuscella]